MKRNLLVGKELRNSKEFVPGMTLLNANGDVDTASLGYQYTIQTTTQIRAKTITQKFYTVPPADYISVIPGTGAWMEDIKTNITYDVAAAFESGIISTASGPARIANVDVGLSSINSKITTIAKGYQYSTPELQKALASNNWDVVAAKLEALKRHFDLGMQKIAFLGLINDLTNSPGLLTNANVTVNTGRIVANISSLSAANFAVLVAGMLADYQANCSYTAMPNTFLIPTDDYVGLATPVASGFPVVSMLTYLEDAFKRITGNANFKIAPLAYGIGAQNLGYVSAIGKSRYVLYNNNIDTLWMDVPVPFTLTPAGTANNFQWQGVGVIQLTGVTIARPAEVLYYDHAS